MLISPLLWFVQVDASREAHTQALQELSLKLQQEYEEKLQGEQQKHREEIEKLQVCTPWSLTLTIADALSIPRPHNILKDECMMRTPKMYNTLGFDPFYKNANCSVKQSQSDVQPKFQ